MFSNRWRSAGLTALLTPVALVLGLFASTPIGSAAPATPIKDYFDKANTALQTNPQEAKPSKGQLDFYKTVTTQGGPTPFNILGTDDRIRLKDQYRLPGSATTLILRNGYTRHCTGFMVNENTLLTAAHCVWDSQTREIDYNLKYCPGAFPTFQSQSRPDNPPWLKSIISAAPNDNPGIERLSSEDQTEPNGLGDWINWNLLYKPFGCSRSESVTIDPSYAGQQNPANDWAIVKLKSNIGDKSGYFGMSASTLKPGRDSIHTVGYPGDKSYGSQHAATTKTYTFVDKAISHKLDTCPGQSGSPIFKDGFYAVGVHNRANASCDERPGNDDEWNYGAQLTSDRINSVIGR